MWKLSFLKKFHKNILKETWLSSYFSIELRIIQLCFSLNSSSPAWNVYESNDELKLRKEFSTEEKHVHKCFVLFPQVTCISLESSCSLVVPLAHYREGSITG